MSSDSKFFLGVVIAAVLIIGGIVLFSGKSPSASVNVDTTIGQKLGPDDAKVKIVEFGDFQCPACQAAAKPFHQLQKDNSDVQIIFRYFPLTNIHQNAEASALAAYAAAQQNKFWEMYDLLYERQADWENITDPTTAFVDYAKELGLDDTTFKNDQTSDAAKETVKTDMDYGLSINIGQTPTFFVNGKQVVGAQTADQWQKLLDDARAN